MDRQGYDVITPSGWLPRNLHGMLNVCDIVLSHITKHL